MNLLQVNTSVNTGSTGRITEEIGRTVMERGHNSYIAYSSAGHADSESRLIKIGNRLDVYMHGALTRLFDMHGFGSKRATKMLVKQIRRIDPDVIGLHNLHGYYLNIEVLFTYLKEVQKPVVWTFHDCWPFTGHCTYFDYVSCEKWKSECYDCPLTDKYPASYLLDRSRPNFHRKKEIFHGLENLVIVTPSRWLKNLVEQSFLSGYPVEVIHNGINLERFHPADTAGIKKKYGLDGKKVLLGVASVWDRRKGLTYFSDLNRQLDGRYKIVVVGLNEGQLKELPDDITGIRRTENIEEMVALYSAADVFVNPTLVDNFPTTNLEALACGTPVVTFNTGGSPEAVDSNTGLVVAKGDAGKLADAIRTINEKGKEHYTEKCRERAIKNYRSKDRYQDYLQLYNRMT